MMIRLLTLIFCLQFYLVANSQNWFRQELDTSAMLIGDQQYLHQYSTSIQFSQDPIVAFDTLSWMEILETHAWNKKEDGSFVRNIRFTVFDSGQFTFPEFPVSFGQDTVWSEALNLKVGFANDSSGTLRPIKDIVETDLANEMLWYYIGAAIVLIVMILLLYLLFKADQRNPASLQFKTIDSPDLKALKELEQLRKEKLWQQGLIKPYYDRLTFILREFLEDGFFFPARSLSSNELKDYFQNGKLELKASANLFELMSQSDLIRFANRQGTLESHDQWLNTAEEIVSQNVPLMHLQLEMNRISYLKYFEKEISDQFENPEETIPNTLLELHHDHHQMSVLTLNLIPATRLFFHLPESWVSLHHRQLGLINHWFKGLMESIQNPVLLWLVLLPVLFLISGFFPFIIIFAWIKKVKILGSGIFTLSKNRKLLVDQRKLQW